VKAAFNIKNWPTKAEFARLVTGQPFHGLVDLLFMGSAIFWSDSGASWGAIAFPLIVAGIVFRLLAQLNGSAQVKPPYLSGVYRFSRMPYSFGSYLVWTGLAVMSAQASLQLCALVVAALQVFMFLRVIEAEYAAAKDPSVHRYVALTSLLLPQVSPTPQLSTIHQTEFAWGRMIPQILKRDRGLFFGIALFVLTSIAASSQPLYRAEFRLVASSLLLLMAIRSFIRDFARKSFRADARIYP